MPSTGSNSNGNHPSKSAYLSKYLDNNDQSDDDAKKKKRKKDKKKKDKKKSKAVVLVHDDSDDSLLQKNPTDEESDDDGPLIVNAEEQTEEDRKEVVRQQQRGTWEDEPLEDSRSKRYDSDSGDSDIIDRPPRRRHDSSEDEDDDAPSSKRQRHDSDGDSDNNKKRTRYDSDSNGDENNQKTATSRKRYDSESDKSSDSCIRKDKRRQRYDSDDDDGKERRQRHDSDDASSDSDRQRKSKRRRHDSGSSDNDDGSVDSKGRPTKLSSGHKAGLQQGRQFSKAEAKIQAKRKKVVEAMVEEHGMGETVFRNPDGTISEQKELSAEDIERQQKRQRYLLNQGSAQLAKNKAMYEERQQLSQASFARRREDVDEDFKHIQRDGDPMAKYNSNNNRKNSTAGGGVGAKAVYKGPPAPPNRYGIKPGYRWDGQHRGNNFERQLLAKQFAKQHHKEQAYKYSSADM